MKYKPPPNNLLSVEVHIKPIHKQTILFRFGHTKLDLWDRKIHIIIFIQHICIDYFTLSQRVVDTDESTISSIQCPGEAEWQSSETQAAEL